MKPAPVFTRSVYLLAVLGIAGLVLALALRERSFPVASVDFRVLAPQAEERAREFLGARGFDLDGYRSAVAFGVDETGKNYVHRVAGLAELNRLARDELAVWRWQVRFYREQEQEEYSVYLTPDGRLTSFSHTMPEARPGQYPSLENARSTAISFLSQVGISPESYREVTASSSRRDARLDYLFTWERTGFRVGEATARVDVWLQGGEIGGFNEYLKVPEEWRRAQAIEANRGNVLAVAGWALAYALGLGMAFLVLLRLRAGKVNWRFAVVLSVLVSAVGVATGLNSLPLLMVEYPTTATIPAYLFGRAVDQAGTLLPGGVAVVLAGLAGEYVYSRIWPGRLRPSLLFSLQGARSPEFARGIAVGYAVAGIWFGYVTVFYSVANALFGAWSPAEVPYRDLMSTVLPALYPLTVGFSAAISEELMFRLFAVPLFLWGGLTALSRLLEASWNGVARGAARAFVAFLAVVVPAAIWGSLHATYPQQPFFIRAVELALVGSVSALVMARFGILATITAHYVYNAGVIGGLFLLSGSAYLQVSAVVVVGLPLLSLLPAARGLRAWTQPEVTGSRQEFEPAVKAREFGPEVTEYGERWGPPARVVLAVVLFGLLCLAVALAWRVPRLGDNLRVSAGGEVAAEKATELASQLGFETGVYRQVTWFADWSGGTGSEYLLRRVGTAATNDFLARELGGYVWQTRFFRSLERGEVYVRFDSAGRFHGLDLRLPDEAPGARLDRLAAQRVAEFFVRERGRAEALDGTLVSASAVERPARVDHTFEWERPDGKVGEAALRLRVAVKGDRVGEYLVFVKVPEAFERHLVGRGLADVGLDLARDGLPFAVLVVGVIVFILRFRTNRLDFRFAAVVSGAMAFLDLLGWVNALPTLFAGYWTSIDLEGFVAWRVVDLLRGVGGDTVWRFVLFAAGESVYRGLMPGRATLTAQMGAMLRPGPAERAAAVVALATAPALWLLLAAYRAAREGFAMRSLGAEGTVPVSLLNGAFPTLAVWQGNLSFALWVGLGALCVSAWLWMVTRRSWAVALVWTLALTVVYAGRLEEWERLLVEAVRWGAFVALVWGLASRVLRDNIIGYPLALFTFLAGRDALFLLGQPNGNLALAGGVAMAGALAPSLWFLLGGYLRSRFAAGFDRPQGR